MSNYNQSSQYIPGAPQQSYNASSTYNPGTGYIPGVPQQNFQPMNNYSVNPSINSYNQPQQYPVSTGSTVGFNTPYDSTCVPVGCYTVPTSNIYGPPDASVQYSSSRNYSDGGYSAPSNMPGGGYNAPPNMPGGSYNAPPNMPGGGYNAPPNMPGGGYNAPPNMPGGGYNAPPNMSGGGYNTPSNMSGGNYDPPNVPIGTCSSQGMNSGGYVVPQNIPGASSYGGPSAPLGSDHTNDTTFAKSYSGEMAGVRSKDASKEFTPEPAPRKVVKGSSSNNDKSGEYQKGLDKLAALMNDDVSLTDAKLKEDRTKYDLNKS